MSMIFTPTNPTKDKLQSKSVQSIPDRIVLATKDPFYFAVEQVITRLDEDVHTYQSSLKP